MEIKKYVIPVQVRFSIIRECATGKYYLHPIVIALNTHFGFDPAYQFVFRIRYSHNLRARTEKVRLVVLDLGDEIEYKLDEQTRKKYLLYRKKQNCLQFVFPFSVTEKALHLIYRAQIRLRLPNKGIPTTYKHNEHRT